MTEEVMTLRALLNELVQKPNKYKLHKFFERLVIMQEEMTRETMRIKARIKTLEEYNEFRAVALKAKPEQAVAS